MMREFSILDYGARPDTAELQTAAIQSCIDDCFLNGGGTVIVPKGTFRTGGLRIRSDVTLLLKSGSVLCGSRDPMDYMAIRTDTVEPLKDDDRSDALYATNGNRKNNDHLNKPGSRWNNALLRAVDAENIAVIGEEGALIDGMDPFDEIGEEAYRGPHGMDFHRCRNVTLRGYTIQNTGNWAHALFDIVNLSVDHVTVLAGHDGVNIRSCENVLIEDCNFYTGDDCIAGIDNRNVIARRCEVNTACSGLRFGGTNAVIEDCHFYGPARYLFRGSLTKEEKRSGKPIPNAGDHRYNMLSLFTYNSDFSLDIRTEPGNIILRNCVCENADRFLHYNFSGNEPWQQNRPLKSIRFENVTATGIRYPITAYGDAACPVRLEIIDCHLSFAKISGMQGMSLCHWEDVLLKNVTVDGLDTDAFAKAWSDGPAIRAENFRAEGVDRELLTAAKEPFSCKPI